ncbi:hypothetical protein OBBRIDRAFT_799690 [Obba rivulosa]|uniref:C3H1-type domain-containing protein n=1 Tax=Obba rivulosa TaxID=1052685 RepID=A0A8E2AFU8_9APHY|nr:hypothetical protein OBBRIDRAFT_799690 [Obba rivulosa]
MDPGYDLEDEARDFAVGFSIVRKDHSSAKKPLRSEADWDRTFDAWAAGVALFYPHRVQELAGYKEIIKELFRYVMDVSTAVQTDQAIRDKYAKNPFRLDDRSRHSVFLMAQASRISKGSPSSTKRPLQSQASPSAPKRQAVPCRNWNMGICNGDPCEYRRKHGVCWVCGDPHRANSQPECKTAFQAGQGKRST